MTTGQLPTLRLGGKQYPVVLPNRRDPRLHLAAVIISIHVIGVTALGFRVSVPQILAAIVVCALIEVGWNLNQTGTLVWPASAMLTGSGIALILRVVGTESGDYWSWRGWYLFALVGALALFTKYVVRYQGTHLFNPSNVALVAVFLLLGSSRVEPLDFWWAPLDGWMLAAYAIILAGGVLITSRIRLLPMALAFWVTLAAGLGLLAASGHCITARWALHPVCGSEFWWVVVASPEILIFLFFMITDPKTIPAGRAARVMFAAGIALLCTLLIAPQTTEFGAKVALLAGLVLMSPLRSRFDRSFPEGNRLRSRFVQFVTTRTTNEVVDIGRSRTFTRGAFGGAVLATVAVLIVVAGTPARQSAEAIPAPQPIAVDVAVDPATLPQITIDAEVAALKSEIEAEAATDLAIMLAENIEIEAEAMRQGEGRLLTAADFGARLAEMQRRVERSVATGEWVVADYRFDTLHLGVVETVGGQGADLGFHATGVVEEVTYNAEGVELRMASTPFASTFVLRQTGGDRWLILDEVDEVGRLATLGFGSRDGRVLAVPGEYPSIRAAIEAAPDGAVVEVKPGRYTEAITINRPLELRGPGDGTAQLVGDGQGPVIEIVGTINVIVEGLAISNGRVGIFVRESQGVVISQNIVENNELRGIHVVNASAEIVGNVIRGTQAPLGIGIHIANASAWPRSVVEDNLVEANGHIGISTNFAGALIRRNTVRANGGRGISVTEMSVASVFDNEIGDNQGPGVLVIDGSTARLERNRIDASSILGREAPIPVQVEYYGAADLIENIIGSEASCAISIGMGSEISGAGNRWGGDPSGCDPLPLGLFSSDR